MICKNIIIFIDSLGSGGAQRRAVNLAALFKKMGNNVIILIYRNDIFYKQILDDQTIKIVNIQASNYLSRIFKIRKYINRSDADVVIAFFETPCFIAEISKIGKNTWKLITTESSSKIETFTTVKNRIFNVFNKYTDFKVCNSYNGYELWKNYYPKQIDKYRVIYNPVIIPINKNRHIFDFNKKRKIKVVVAASYQELKNPLRMIKAIGMLSDEERDRLEICWFGRKISANNNTEVFDKACAMVEKMHLGECIFLNEETEDIYNIMNECDAVGLFSTVEGLPNAICEALALGKIVIMSKVSDYKTLVNGNGFLCDPYSEQSIRDTFLKLLQLNNEEAEIMGKKSMAIAKMFDPVVVWEKWKELL